MLMDKDDSGSLSHQEILGAVKTNAEVKKFLNDCGDRTSSTCSCRRPAAAQGHRFTARARSSSRVGSAIETALKAKRAARRRPRAARQGRPRRSPRSRPSFPARKVFEMIDKDDSGALAKAEIVEAVKSDGQVGLPPERGEKFAVPARPPFGPRAPAARHGQLRRGRRRGMYCAGVLLASAT